MTMARSEPTTPHRCGCPTCECYDALRTIHKQLERISVAHDAWIEQSAESEGNEHFYLDVLHEIAAIVEQPTTSPVMVDGIKAALRYVPKKVMPAVGGDEVGSDDNDSQTERTEP